MNEAAPQAAGGTGRTLDDYALEELRHGWGEAYRIGHDGVRGWWAQRRDGLGGDITAAGPEELRTGIRADYRARRVPRDAGARS